MSTTQHWHLHQWVQSLNCCLEMVHPVTDTHPDLHFASLPHQNGANKPANGQLHTLHSVEATTKQLENQANQ